MDRENLSIKQETGIFEPRITRTTLASTGRASCSLMIPLAILIAILYPLASPASASNAVHTCANSSISIEADESIDHHAICNSAEDALAFFDRLDMKLSCPLVIEIVQNLPDWMSETTVGSYHKAKQKVLVLTFPALEKREVWFGVPVNLLIYSSLVTHEVAHAVAGCNFTISEPTYHAEEYVAYVAMLAMMNPVLRAHVLVENSEASFDSELDFNEITYSLDPMRFGVEAYRHYLKKEHGDTFLLKVLSGNALTNSAHDLP